MNKFNVMRIEFITPSAVAFSKTWDYEARWQVQGMIGLYSLDYLMTPFSERGGVGSHFRVIKVGRKRE